eukprot:TRINITY_DN479_c0_g1_i4.p1 TRINITY_DN479_c0_g1~~TRINITY_DN479_c0_g1_i4.p1  ORF type:complete len:571 (+),score=145.01 TRINITY_DN479_c0_g1_i4:112-1824(+)
MSLNYFLLVWLALTSVGSGQLINNDWAKLERDVTLRYFSSQKFYPSTNQDEIWDKMGENITCTVDKQGKASVVPPSSFDASKPIKLFMHGFTSNGRMFTTNLLPAWMERYGGSSSVILLDWEPLAAASQWINITDMVYNDAAYNGIDVGEFAGLCLAELSNSYGLSADFLHLVGHSLGGQSVGKMGRSFQSAHKAGEKVKRITGLDPAGPRFEKNNYLDALHDLKTNILTAESAKFVDVIHTNGGFTPSALSAVFHWERPRLGYLQQLGHMDFYPDGGSHQSGCPATWISFLEGWACSHSRAIIFYYYSIKEKNLFPSNPCKSATDCNQKILLSDEVEAYMGEDAEQYFNGWKELFYVDVKDCNWNYTVHDNEGCRTVRELTDGEKDTIEQAWAKGQGSGSTSVSVMSGSQCSSVQRTLAMVVKARIAKDCRSKAESAPVAGDAGHKAIVDALRSCSGSEDELCLVQKLGSLDAQSNRAVCRSLFELEDALKTGLGIFCEEELGASASSCSWWNIAQCSGKVIAAGIACPNPGANIAYVECIAKALGAGSQCLPCICSVLKLNPSWCQIF